MFHLPSWETVSGLGSSPAGVSNLERTAVGFDAQALRGHTYSQTLAHEMGHLFGLQHAPAGNASGPDPDYPRPGGFLDAAGLDLEDFQAKDPTQYTDIMGYGEHRWISAYNWTKALEHLARPMELQAEALRDIHCRGV